jgi:peptide/bleomycin uptake transporter
LYYSFFKQKATALKAYGGLAFLLTSLFLQVELTVAINKWYGGFYNILQKATEHSIEEFWEQMYMFAELAFPYVMIATISAYFTRRYSLWWRESKYIDKLYYLLFKPLNYRQNKVVYILLGDK